MAKESIEWATFTCPEGHFKWLVMHFWPKECTTNFSEQNGQNIKKNICNTPYFCAFNI